MSRLFHLGCLLMALALSACGGGGDGGSTAPNAPPVQQDPPNSVDNPDPPADDQPDPPPDETIFVDVTATSGIEFTIGFADAMRNDEVPIVVPNGVASGDYDGDGDIDLFVVRGDLGPNLLYRNLGAMVFEEVAAEAGVAFTKNDNENYRHSSPALADLDGDGDLDLLLAGLEGDPTKIYHNNGNGTFSDVSEGSGLDAMRAEYSMSTAFGDYDLDGDLDLAFGHWGTPRDYINGVGDTEHLWRNDSDDSGIRFTSVSIEAGIAPSVILNPDPYVSQRSFDHTFTPTFARIDDDEYPDLLMVGDFNFSQVFINNRDGTFTNVTDYEVIKDGNGMGSAVGDYDNDGDLDWFVSSIEASGNEVPSHLSRIGNRLYRNDNGVFVDATEQANVASGGWGWGSCFMDFENDGDLDIYHTNGWPDESLNRYGGFLNDPSRAFVSNGDGTFVNRSGALGLGDTEQGRGVVCADFDNDGDTDILLLHANSTNAATLYRNISTGNNYLAVELRGRSPNTAGVGARIVIQADGNDYLREVTLGSNFASHNPTRQIFGLGSASQVDRMWVYWPDGGETFIQAVAANQLLVVEQEENEEVRVEVNQGSGGGFYSAGDTIEISAAEPADQRYAFSHWTLTGEGTIGDRFSPTTTYEIPDSPSRLTANYLPGPSLQTDVSIARRWNEVLLQAIRNDYARPTVHARNLFHISSAIYDAWAAYDEQASPWLLGNSRLGESCETGQALYQGSQAEQEQVLSYAAYRLIVQRFINSPGQAQTKRDADNLMDALGYDITVDTVDATGASAASLGNYIADCYLRFGLVDGANEQNDYANTAYEPVNPPLRPHEPGNPDIVDLNRWQPLSLQTFIDQSGNLADNTPAFLSPEWGVVYPFALEEADVTEYQRDGYTYRVYHDPGPPPTIEAESEIYKWAFNMVSIWSSHLDPADGVMIDISPNSIGNIQSFPQFFTEHPDFYQTYAGGDASIGYDVNPVNGEPYQEQMVPRADYARVLAEFWADGPDSETPPGHWFVILNEVNEHSLLERKFEGIGEELNPLEWDIKAYFLLGGAMHDAAISAWGIKGWYDYIRPISAIRAMADLGQSSDPDLASYHQDGIALDPGYIELVEEGDPLAGELDEHVGKIKLKAWLGPERIENPLTDTAGVDWMLAENWWPYQRPSFVTPPFAGYVSGHSTYSRAAAEVMTALTGSPYFPGGMSGFEIEQFNFLVFENGPSVDMSLQWATYRDASDQCSLSRIWGGIHPSLDDIPGRLIGEQIGLDAFEQARSFFEGSAID